MKKLFLVVLLAFLYGNIYAQVQKVSLRPPAGMKIDGKILEWPNNKLNTYSVENKLTYTVSNDDDNLYLSVRTTYFYGSAKTINGGLTFTVSKSVDKKAREKAKDNVAITFPVLDFETAQGIVNTLNSYEHVAHDTIKQQRAHDSLMLVLNTKTANAIKDIKVIGIKEIPDPLISIYNETGIKVMGGFNRAMAFVIEMAIPLKYLGFSANDETKFSYNIRLNVPPQMVVGPGIGIGIDASTTSIQAAQAADYFQYMHTSSEFWGEYTLAKKL